MQIVVSVAEVTPDSGTVVGSDTRITEDQIEVAVFKAATELVTLLRTRFDSEDDVFVTVEACVQP